MFACIAAAVTVIATITLYLSLQTTCSLCCVLGCGHFLQRLHLYPHLRKTPLDSSGEYKQLRTRDREQEFVCDDICRRLFLSVTRVNSTGNLFSWSSTNEVGSLGSADSVHPAPQLNPQPTATAWHFATQISAKGVGRQTQCEQGQERLFRYGPDAPL